MTLTFTITDDALKLGCISSCFSIYGLDNLTSNTPCDEYSAVRLADLKGRYTDSSALIDPALLGFRKLHEKIGKTGKRWTSSPENLRRLLMELPAFPRINQVVDLYNIASLETGLAMGAHDITHICGNVTLRLTDGTEKFMPLGAKVEEKVSAGEYSYCDDSNEVICRMEVRQGEKTKVTPQSKDVFFIVQGNEDTPDQEVKDISRKLAELIKLHLGGTYRPL